MRTRIFATGLIGCAMLISGCSADADGSAGAPDDLAFNEAAEESASTLVLIESIPDVDLTDEELEMVIFEANWVCELQRRTFESPGALEVALDAKLADLGVTRDAYDSFRSEANGSQDLRDSILFAYQETCFG